MLVLITTDPESLDSDNEFVRVCPISPFIEMATSTDQICDDSSIVGFPFLVETWNEQPILVDLLDKYAGNYYSDLIEKDEVLNQSQNEFREIVDIVKDFFLMIKEVTYDVLENAIGGDYALLLVITVGIIGLMIICITIINR